MSDPSGGLPSGMDPSDPASPIDSSLGADRAAAIEAEKKKWRDKVNKPNRSKKSESRGTESDIEAEPGE
jgi:hypothetical protein